MRQLMYESVRTAPHRQAELEDILAQSRHNNALDGVTGLLWADGKRFLQIIEGSVDSVATTYARIVADTRHRDLRLLLDRETDAAEFGAWSMALRRAGETTDEFDDQLGRLIEPRSIAVSDHFKALIVRRTPTRLS